MSIIITIKAIPSSGRHSWSVDTAGRLKCYLKSSPEHGKANKELIGLLSRALRLPEATIAIVAGATSRTKRVLITGDIKLSQIYQALGIPVQYSIE